MDEIAYIGLILGSLICALVGYYVGKAKGKPESGAIWGALLGPIGWLIAAILPEDGPKCPECLGVLPKGAKRCKHCGVILNVPTYRQYTGPSADDITPSFYVQNGEKTEGPFTRSHLKMLLKDRKITSETLVARNGESDWYPVSLVV